MNALAYVLLIGIIQFCRCQLMHDWQCPEVRCPELRCPPCKQCDLPPSAPTAKTFHSSKVSEPRTYYYSVSEADRHMNNMKRILDKVKMKQSDSFKRLAAIKEVHEERQFVTASLPVKSTVDEIKILSSPEQQSSTTKKPRSTIPTATWPPPPKPTSPLPSIEAWNREFNDNSDEITVNVTDISSSDDDLFAQSAEDTSTSAHEYTKPNDNISLSGLDMIVADVSHAKENKDATERPVPVDPAGYKTDPRFSADEISIEEKKCNDDSLMNILVEGMRVDDSAGSKRSISALLNIRKKSTPGEVSVMCSHQELAFRLVARKFCQLTAGTATCILFTL